MKATHITSAAALLGIALSLTGCGFGTKEPHIYLENNSDHAIVLQARTPNGPAFKLTAPPHQSRQTLNSPPSGHCYEHWEIVDENSQVLREIGRVCADDHIVYP